VSAVVGHVGWSLEAILVVVAGTGLTFGVWWNYFILPSAEVLARRRERSWIWGYGHILVFASIAAMGAGLHVAAYVVEGEATIGTVGAVLATAIPVAVGTLVTFALYCYLLHGVDALYVGQFAGTLVVLGVAVVLAAVGVPFAWCLVVVMAAPVVTLVGFEVAGHRRQAEALRALG